jgi:hypothetical protein
MNMTSDTPETTDDGATDDPVDDDAGRTTPTTSSGGTTLEHRELVDATPIAEPERQPETNYVTEPAQVMRIGSMVKQLLEEVRQAPLDEASRERLAEVYERSVVELSGALSPDLQQELQLLTLPFNEDAVPSEGELRVAQAQLVGWLEGLFHGIQATLFAQQMAARQQLENMRGQGQLPSGGPGEERPGTYL